MPGLPPSSSNANKSFSLEDRQNMEKRFVKSFLDNDARAGAGDFCLDHESQIFDAEMVQTTPDGKPRVISGFFKVIENIATSLGPLYEVASNACYPLALRNINLVTGDNSHVKMDCDADPFLIGFRRAVFPTGAEYNKLLGKEISDRWDYSSENYKKAVMLDGKKQPFAHDFYYRLCSSLVAARHTPHLPMFYRSLVCVDCKAIAGSEAPPENSKCMYMLGEVADMTLDIWLKEAKDKLDSPMMNEDQKEATVYRPLRYFFAQAIQGANAIEIATGGVWSLKGNNDELVTDICSRLMLHDISKAMTSISKDDPRGWYVYDMEDDRIYLDVRTMPTIVTVDAPMFLTYSTGENEEKRPLDDFEDMLTKSISEKIGTEAFSKAINSSKSALLTNVPKMSFDNLSKLQDNYFNSNRSVRVEHKVWTAMTDRVPHHHFKVDPEPPIATFVGDKGLGGVLAKLKKFTTKNELGSKELYGNQNLSSWESRMKKEKLRNILTDIENDPKAVREEANRMMKILHMETMGKKATEHVSLYGAASRDERKSIHNAFGGKQVEKLERMSRKRIADLLEKMDE